MPVFASLEVAFISNHTRSCMLYQRDTCMETWKCIERITRREEIMFKRLSTITIVICAIAVITISQSAYAQPEELVLWNKLGSQTEVENSEVGPDGTFIPSPGNGFIAEGMFGGAYVVDHTVREPLVNFPIDAGSSPLYEGAIEFWARLIEFPYYIPCTNANPALLGVTGNLGTYLNCNNGLGGGGLTGGAGLHFHAWTGPYGSWWTYEKLLGVGQAGDWHHYALVWDKDGIDCGGYGTHKVAMFLDGQLNSRYWWEPSGYEFLPLVNGQLALAYTVGAFVGRFAIDNVIFGTTPKPTSPIGLQNHRLNLWLPTSSLGPVPIR